MLPSALLLAASKIQVQTILRYSITRSKSVLEVITLGHHVSNTATRTSLLRTWSIPERKSQTGFKRATIPWQNTFSLTVNRNSCKRAINTRGNLVFSWRIYHPKQSLRFLTCFSFACSPTSYLAFHSSYASSLSTEVFSVVASKYCKLLSKL